jgi:hypothetical protein
MRSIGKRNIELVKTTTKRIIKENPDLAGKELREKIFEELPEELWDTWEMAHQEIVTTIHDTIIGD